MTYLEVRARHALHTRSGGSHRIVMANERAVPNAQNQREDNRQYGAFAPGVTSQRRPAP
jgi:hypothetical protein